MRICSQLLLLFLFLGCLNSVFGVTITGTGTGAIPDGTGANVCGANRDVSFVVSGAATPVLVTSVSLTATHTWVGDLRVVLIAPNGTTFVIFSNVGKQVLNTTDFGDDSDLGGGAYVFQDSGPANFWTAANTAGAAANVLAGSYRLQAAGPAATDSPGPAFTSLISAFAGVPNPNGTWTLRFNDCFQADLGTVTAASITLLSASAANSSIRGRVVTPSGRGIGNARLTLSDAQGEPRTVMTNPFGYFNILEVPSGKTYILTVSSKNYSFAQPSRAINVGEDLAGLEFVADP